MSTIGIRELKNQTTEILRTVREQQTEYIVTYRGQPVAMILPLTEAWRQTINTQSAQKVTPSANLWAELDELRKEIDRAWQSEKTAVELVIEQRR